MYYCPSITSEVSPGETSARRLRINSKKKKNTRQNNSHILPEVSPTQLAIFHPRSAECRRGSDLERDPAGDLVEGEAGDEVAHDAGRAAPVETPEAVPLPHVIHWRTRTKRALTDPHDGTSMRCITRCYSAIPITRQAMTYFLSHNYYRSVSGSRQAGC